METTTQTACAKPARMENEGKGGKQKDSRTILGSTGETSSSLPKAETKEHQGSSEETSWIEN